jgi:hypothetical protein
MNSPLLLTYFEQCARKGYWGRLHERIRLDDTEMLQTALRAGLTTERTDFGDCAGEECYGLGVEPGLNSDFYDVHSQVVHLSCLADIICCAIRKPLEAPWTLPEPIKLGGDGPLWTSGAYLSPDGSHLRRVVLATSWNDNRHYSEARSWFSLGECAAYDLPMQQATIILGQNRDGKRHSHWTKALLHPVNRKLRFRKKHDVSEGFKSTWLPVWREDHDEITTSMWLQGMLDDGVLSDLCFSVEIPALEKSARQRILDLAASKLEKVQNLDSLPEPQLSTCDWPQKCLFRDDCHAGRFPRKGVFRLLEK